MLNKLWEISIISLKIIKNKYIFLKTRAKRTLKKEREREREKMVEPHQIFFLMVQPP
jgi:hypothetical protein